MIGTLIIVAGCNFIGASGVLSWLVSKGDLKEPTGRKFAAAINKKLAEKGASGRVKYDATTNSIVPE